MALALKLLLVFLGIYVFFMAEKHSILKTPIIFIGLLSWFFFRQKTKHPLIWIILALLLIFDLCFFYFRVANHHFLLTFVVLSIVLYYYHQRVSILLKNIQMLLFIVVVASAFQKLCSSQFMSGEFYYYLLNRGFAFDLFHPLFPDVLEIAKDNSKRILELQNTDPNLRQQIVIEDVIPNLEGITLIYVWITVIVEFIVALALLLKPRSTWTHLLFITMIVGIICTRLEMGFMTLLAICGLLLCDNQKLKLVYVLIVMGCITLMVTKIGYP